MLNLREIFRGRQALQSVVANTGLLLSDRVLRYGLGFMIGAGIARYLGPEQYGLLSYVLALIAILIPLLGIGLDNVVIRELVQFPDQKNEILGTVFSMRIAGALTLSCVSGIVTMTLRTNDADSLRLVLVMASATLLLSTDVIELFFQSRLQSRFPIYGKGFAFIMVSILKIYLIVTHGSVMSIVLAGFLESFLGAVGLVFFFHRNGQHVRDFRFSSKFLKRLTRIGWALVISGLAAIVSQRVDQLFISNMLGDAAVGVYSAAFRFSEFAYAIPALISISVLPILVETKKSDIVLYQQRIQTFYSLMTLCSISLSIGFTLLSGFIVPLLFGEAFSAASTILSVQIWSCVFLFLTVASNQYLIVEGKTNVCLYRTLMGAGVSITLNSILIPRNGLLGAAVTGVVSSFVSAFSVVLFSKDMAESKRMLHSFRLDMTIRTLFKQLKALKSSQTV